MPALSSSHDSDFVDRPQLCDGCLGHQFTHIYLARDGEALGVTWIQTGTDMPSGTQARDKCENRHGPQDLNGELRAYSSHAHSKQRVTSSTFSLGVGKGDAMCKCVAQKDGSVRLQIVDEV